MILEVARLGVQTGGRRGEREQAPAGEADLAHEPAGVLGGVDAGDEIAAVAVVLGALLAMDAHFGRAQRGGAAGGPSRDRPRASRRAAALATSACA